MTALDLAAMAGGASDEALQAEYRKLFEAPFCVVRPGLWCDGCMRSAAFEQDVFDGGVLIATLQGCPTCLTGIFAVKETAHGG